jgi:serine/threonine protein kinase
MRDADPRLGALLGGRYRLERALGAGAMGAIYEAVHVDLDKRVAVKIMSASADSSDPRPSAHEGEIAARFRREARAAGRIASEYVLEVYDVGRDPKLGMFMVTELLSGEDLETRLAREIQLDVEPALTIGYQVARGLSAAHAVGVVHRDLKPSNIFLTTKDDGSLLAKIVDFGVAKVASCPDGPLTAKGTALGTPEYMAPEQLEGALDVDGRADVWSLAACIYEMLSGKSPFSEHGSYLDIMIAIARDAVEPLRSRAPWVPLAVAEVVDQGLERDRAFRTADAATFAELLRRAGSKHRARERRAASSTMRRVSVPPAGEKSRGSRKTK